MIKKWDEEYKVKYSKFRPWPIRFKVTKLNYINGLKYTYEDIMLVVKYAQKISYIILIETNTSLKR